MQILQFVVYRAWTGKTSSRLPTFHTLIANISLSKPYRSLIKAYRSFVIALYFSAFHPSELVFLRSWYDKRMRFFWDRYIFSLLIYLLMAQAMCIVRQPGDLLITFIWFQFSCSAAGTSLLISRRKGSLDNELLHGIKIDSTNMLLKDHPKSF